jgi:hypothetical protein
MDLQPIAFLILYTVGRILWTGNQSHAKTMYIKRTNLVLLYEKIICVCPENNSKQKNKICIQKAEFLTGKGLLWADSLENV